MGADRRASLRLAGTAFLWSRLLVFGAAAYAVLGLTPSPQAVAYANFPFDFWGAIHPFADGWLGSWANVVGSSLARWDAAWYLELARDGYAPDAAATDDGRRPAFFPLYPFLVRALAGFSGSEAAIMVAAYAVSAAASVTALYLLHRLTQLELDRAAADAAVVLLAVFPSSYFLAAPYAESLLLALSIGSVYAARLDRWALASLLAAGAALTRPTGMLLGVLLGLLYLRRRRPAPDVLWLLAIPAAVAAFSLYLDRAVGEPFAWLTSQGDAWSRPFVAPFAAVWEGIEAGYDALKAIGRGPVGAPEFGKAGDLGLQVHAGNLLLLAFLVAAAVAAVGVARRLPPAYGAFVVITLAAGLSSPNPSQPLVTLHRQLVVLFPIVMWAGWALSRRDRMLPAVAACSVALGVLTAQFATWHLLY